MEFVTTETRLPVITTNFEEVKKYIEEKRDMYKGIIVTEDTLKESRADLSELIKIRTCIDKFRKDKKKEMSAPIIAFENQCKELLAIEAEAESPLVEGIKQFDEERRQKKKEQALKFIAEAVADRGLNAKYAAKLALKDNYMLLTATIKGVKKEIGRDADMLLAEQKQEEADISLIEHTVEKENEDLFTKLNATEFCLMVNQKTVQEILDIIKQRAFDIREAQKKAEEKARVAMEEAKKAMEKTVIDTPPIITPSANSDTVSVNYSENKVMPEQKMTQEQALQEEQWSVTFTVNGSFNQVRELCNFLKAKQLSYNVIKQEKL